MKKVLLYSWLLIGGLVLGQIIDQGPIALWVRLGTMFCLSFIMVHVGYEFEIDKSRPGQYAWDYAVAFTAAAFPWVFVTAYFVFVMSPQPLWGHMDLWKETLLAGRFASPTSAGVLFSMLAAAGLATTWVFRKARILAIFDDLDTILLMIPLKMLMVGMRWQLWTIVAFIVLMLMMAWRYLHVVRLPVTWPWVMLYSALIVLVSEMIYIGSKGIDPMVPIHLEVLLPAFVMGCALKRPAGHDPHRDDHREGHQEGPESPGEQRIATIVAAGFMVLVGLSMPPIQLDPTRLDADVRLIPAADDVALTPAATDVAPAQRKSILGYEGAPPEALAKKRAFPGWGMIALHVLVVTVLSNIGKMYPVFCYRREAPWQHRLAVAVGMFPRGEVGAGVLVISLGYGLGGPILTVAVLSLALNLLCTGMFIFVVRKLLAAAPERPQAA